MRRLFLVCSASCLAAALAWSSSFLAASAQTGSGRAHLKASRRVALPLTPMSTFRTGPRPAIRRLWTTPHRDASRLPAGRRALTTHRVSAEPIYTSDDGVPARFKVEIPATGSYSVYAWWPARASNSAAARFGVSTTSGVKWTEVDQRKDGGMWVKLGAYEMEAGDSYAIQISGSSEAAGDVARRRRSSAASRRPRGRHGGKIAGASVTAARRHPTGRDVVRKARRAYRHPLRDVAPGPLQVLPQGGLLLSHQGRIQEVWRSLPDDPRRQWKRGERVKKKANLRPGDLVFFDENRNGRLQPWDHVGIYSGHRNLIHASSFFGRVVESKMKYIHGYWGAKRLKSLR